MNDSSGVAEWVRSKTKSFVLCVKNFGNARPQCRPVLLSNRGCSIRGHVPINMNLAKDHRLSDAIYVAAAPLNQQTPLSDGSRSGQVRSRSGPGPERWVRETGSKSKRSVPISNQRVKKQPTHEAVSGIYQPISAKSQGPKKTSRVAGCSKMQVAHQNK